MVAASEGAFCTRIPDRIGVCKREERACGAHKQSVAGQRRDLAGQSLRFNFVVRSATLKQSSHLSHLLICGGASNHVIRQPLAVFASSFVRRRDGLVDELRSAASLTATCDWKTPLTSRASSVSIRLLLESWSPLRQRRLFGCSPTVASHVAAPFVAERIAAAVSRHSVGSCAFLCHGCQRCGKARSCRTYCRIRTTTD